MRSHALCACLAVAVAAPLAGAGSAAHAASWANASLRDFTVILEDLDPADGVTPSVAWSSDIGSYIGLRAISGLTSCFCSGAFGSELFAPVAARGEEGPASAEGRVHGSYQDGTLSFEARGQAGSPTLGNPSEYQAISKLSYGDVWMTVSPRTAGRLVAWADLAAGVTPAPPGSTLQQWAAATASFRFLWLDEGFQNVDEYVNTDETIGQVARTGVAMSLSFENLSDSPRLAYLELEARVWGEGAGLLAAVPEVPEPRSAVLLGLGLAAMLLFVRRARPAARR
ncbi:MAG: PEP-CTERM sorting domain-containing protein [Comamonadaceae bacterium]|nr:PEP-CTERM sorting domain-containing protein [Comamonadaceae bacterium]